MSDPVLHQDLLDLEQVRDHEDYIRTLAGMLGHNRSTQEAAVLSTTEAHVAAELLGQYAQLDPTGALNQLARTLASRLYHRLGA